MGHEIVYCFKCQTRILGTEFEKGLAFQVGENVCCAKCAAEVLHTLPPKEREQLLAQMFKATKERRSGGTNASLPAMDAPATISSTRMRAASATPPGGVERRLSGPDTRRRWAEQSRNNMTLACLAALVIAGAGVLMLRSGGGPDPAPRSVAHVAPPVAPPPVAGTDQEHEDVRKARDFARVNPQDLDGQLAAWRGALLTASRPSEAELAKREVERLQSLQRESVKNGLAELDALTKPYLDKEEFAAAAALLRSSRAKRATPEWTLAVDRKVDEARAIAASLLPGVKDQALKARGRKADEEIKAHEARVRKWGYGEMLAELEAAIAAPAETPPTPPTSPATPAVSKEVETYRSRWTSAILRAVGGDTPGASQDVTSALEGVKDAAVRAEAAEDLEALRRIGLATQEIKEAVARTSKGQKVSLERWSASGAPEKVEGTAAGAEPGRLLVRTDAGLVPVEIGELTPGLISDLFSTRAGKKPGDERTAALLGVFAGDLDRAGRLKVELPERWRLLAAKAPGVVTQGPEADARRLYAEAEDAATDPTRVATAIKNYKALLADYAATGFVARNRPLLASRSNLGKEYLFFPDTMRGSGTFRLDKAGKMEAAWISDKDSDPAAAAQNYVELSFTALPDADYKLWVYAAGCCLENFAFGVQGTDLVLPTAKSTLAEPGAAAAVPIRPPLSLKKTHAQHTGPKSPTRWEWIPVPLPKYAASGVKVVRFLTDQQGFAIAYASLSALTSNTPRESEVRELEKSRSRRLVSERDIPGLVAHWRLDEGGGRSVADAVGKLTGTLHGATWAAGRQGAGLRFDGGSAWAELPNAPAIDTLANGSYTIAAWFQPADLPPGQNDQNNAQYAILMRTGRHSGLAYRGDGTFSFIQWHSDSTDPAKVSLASAVSKAVPAGTFHHVAGVLDRAAGRMSIYVNGRAEAAAPVDPAVRVNIYNNSTWKIGIGGPDQPTWRWCANGVVDDVRFYNRALGAVELEAIYRSAGTTPIAKAPPASADGRPWKPVFDGQTSNCIVGEARSDWPVKDGALTNVPGRDNAAQTTAEFGDGEVRVRFESRGNSVCWFLIRQHAVSGYTVDCKQLGDAMNQGEHELVFTCRGPSVTATLDGKPAVVYPNGSPLKGMLQFNCSVDGTLKVKSIEYRDLK
jgi:hypothetical protein